MASKNDLIKLHIDTLGFTSKPGSGEKANSISAIISRTSRNVVQITKEEFVEKVLSGYSFIPGVCPMSEEAKVQYGKGALQADWKEQQIFALDFDCGVTMDTVLARLKELEVHPFFAYTTFSSGEKEKFRVAFATSELVVDMKQRDKLQATLIGLFKGEVDRSCANRNRYFNGTRKDARVYLNYDALIDAKWVIDTYWNDEYEEHTPSDSSIRKELGPIKKEKSEKQAKKRGKARVVNNTHRREFVPVEEYPNIYVWCEPKWRKNTKGNIQYIEKIYQEREWYEAEHRERFIFIAYNCHKIISGSRKAYEKCLEYNEGFAEPLSVTEFMWALEHTDMHIETSGIHCDGIYTYGHQRMVEVLELTNNEVESVGLLKTKMKNDRADENRPLRTERNELMEKLHSEGYSSRQIEKELKAVYGEGSKLAINDSSIRFYFRKHRGVGENSTNYYSYNAISPALRRLFEHRNEEETIPTLNMEQQAVLDAALSGHNIVISGYAGTGKSFLIEKISAELRSKGHAVAVCAATGVAAYNIGGSTLHHLFHIYGEEDQERKVTYDLLSEIEEYHTIIVDEAGMVKAKDFQYMCEVLTKVKRKFYKNVQLILVCDVLQLPPVNDAFFFQTTCYQSLGFKHYYLTESIRQQGDAEYAHYINKVRIGEDKVLTSCELNRICSRSVDNRFTYIVPYRSDADRINRQHLSTLDGELISLGNEQYVKVGAKVVVTENYARNGEVKYFNGMQGKVVDVSDNKNVLTVLTTDGRTVKIHRRQVQIGGEWVAGFPISLGYAITVHKSQGMTMEGANIDPRSFAEGQLYVALSRVKTSKGVHLLRPIKPQYIKVNESALAFDEAMRMESARRQAVM